MNKLVQFNANQVVFVTIDMQAKLASAIADFDAVATTLLKAKTVASLLDIPYIVTEHYKQGLGATLSSLEGNNTIQKNTFATPAQSVAECVGGYERQVYVLGGVEAHVCVMQSALALLSAGKQVVVLADGVASRNPLNKQLALEHLRQVGAWILPFESVAFLCLESCEHPQFKAVLKLIK